MNVRKLDDDRADVRVLQCKLDTMEHKHRVRELLDQVVTELTRRGRVHDQTKLEEPELSLLAEHNHKLAGLTHGSPESVACRTMLEPCLKHHYARNRHHPEHFSNGVEGMNLVDLVEMFCDWKASSERHNDGNLRLTLEQNAKRFGIEGQLRKVLQNSLEVVT